MSSPKPGRTDVRVMFVGHDASRSGPRSSCSTSSAGSRITPSWTSGDPARRRAARGGVPGAGADLGDRRPGLAQAIGPGPAWGVPLPRPDEAPPPLVPADVRQGRALAALPEHDGDLGHLPGLPGPRDPGRRPHPRAGDDDPDDRPGPLRGDQGPDDALRGGLRGGQGQPGRPERRRPRQDRGHPRIHPRAAGAPGRPGPVEGASSSRSTASPPTP